MFVLITTLMTPSFLWIHGAEKQAPHLFANPPKGLLYMDIFFNLLIREVVPSDANSSNPVLLLFFAKAVA